MLVAMCTAGMVTMATVNNKPGVIEIQPTASTSTTSLVTTTSTTTALATSSTVQSTTTVADLTYVLVNFSKILDFYFSAVLILNTSLSSTVPVLTNATGREDKDFNFEIDEEAEVRSSCSLTWQNELYVFGGGSKKTQISKVQSCRLAPIGQLAFNHNGDCVNVAGKAVVLCFTMRVATPRSVEWRHRRLAHSAR